MFASKQNSKTQFPTSIAPIFANGFSTAGLPSIPTALNWSMCQTSADQKDYIKKTTNDQPLDLSTKKSTPSNSPHPSTVKSEPMTSDDEDEKEHDVPLNLVSKYGNV